MKEEGVRVTQLIHYPEPMRKIEKVQPILHNFIFELVFYKAKSDETIEYAS